MNNIEELLNSKSISNLKKAAKYLQIQKEPKFESLIVDCFKREVNSNRSWEVQNELIKAIGVNEFKSALQSIEEICNKNIEYDMVTISAGTCLMRLKRKNLSDVSVLLQNAHSMNYSLGYGLLDALGYDRMLPNQLDIEKIIKACWNFGINRDFAFVDPRYGLAAACAGWKGDIVVNFLHHCVDKGDNPLKHVAQNSLKGKYIKLR